MDTPEIEMTFDSILCLSFLLPACSGTMLIFDSLVFSLVIQKETTISPHPQVSQAELDLGQGFFNIYTYIYMAMGNYPTMHQKSELENHAIW